MSKKINAKIDASTTFFDSGENIKAGTVFLTKYNGINRTHYTYNEPVITIQGYKVYWEHSKTPSGITVHSYLTVPYNEPYFPDIAYYDSIVFSEEVTPLNNPQKTLLSVSLSLSSQQSGDLNSQTNEILYRAVLQFADDIQTQGSGFDLHGNIISWVHSNSKFAMTCNTICRPTEEYPNGYAYVTIWMNYYTRYACSYPFVDEDKQSLKFLKDNDSIFPYYLVPFASPEECEQAIKLIDTQEPTVMINTEQETETQTIDY